MGVHGTGDGNTGRAPFRKMNTEAWSWIRADVIWVLVVQKLLKVSKKALAVHGMASALPLSTRLSDLGALFESSGSSQEGHDLVLDMHKLRLMLWEVPGGKK